jgi:hypothetical protein
MEKRTSTLQQYLRPGILPNYKSASILRKYYARVAHGGGDKAQMKWKFARFNTGKNLECAEAK